MLFGKILEDVHQGLFQSCGTTVLSGSDVNIFQRYLLFSLRKSTQICLTYEV